MNIRRIIYLFAMVLMVLVVYYSGQNTPVSEPQAIERQAILDNFKNARPQEFPSDLIKNGYKPTDIYITDGFIGQAGNEFYVSLSNERQILTLKYVIRAQKTKNGDTTRLEYFCKDRWENYKPPAGKFEQYQLRNGKWVKL